MFAVKLTHGKKKKSSVKILALKENYFLYSVRAHTNPQQSALVVNSRFPYTFLINTKSLNYAVLVKLLRKERHILCSYILY